MLISPYGPLYMAPGDGVQGRVVALLQPTQGAGSYTTDDTGKSLTLSGDAALSTQRPYSGVDSLTFDGSGDYISYADSSDWNFAVGDLTINVMVRPTSGGAGTNRQILFQGPDLSSYQTILISSSDRVRWQVMDASNPLITLDNLTTLTADAWNYVGISRSGSTWTLRVNSTDASTTASITVPDLSASLIVGGIPGTGNWMNGQITSLQIVKGGARPLSTPSSPYTLE
jgi:hypothetical protein